ncbi:hypothetical protein D3C83_92230 [compost metagenome]
MAAGITARVAGPTSQYLPNSASTSPGMKPKVNAKSMQGNRRFQLAMNAESRRITRMSG